MDREFLDKLLEQISVSGCEECGQEVVKSHMQPFSDEIWTDEMGDVICILNVDFSLFRPLEFFVDPKNGDGRNNNPPAMRVRVDCYTKKLPFRVQ